MFYAVGVWNKDSSHFVLPFILPVVVKWQIKGAKNHLNEIVIFYPDADHVFKQVGTGSSATMRVCKPGSLDSQIG